MPTHVGHHLKKTTGNSNGRLKPVHFPLNVDWPVTSVSGNTIKSMSKVNRGKKKKRGMRKPSGKNIVNSYIIALEHTGTKGSVKLKLY